MAADRDPVTEALDGLLAMVDDLDLQVVRLLDTVDEFDSVPLVPVLYRIRVQRQRLAQVEALAERHVTRALGTGKKTIAGVQLDVHGGWQRTEWQHRDVGRLLAELALVDQVTGELDAEQMRVAMQAVYAVLEVCRPEWRVTDLRAAGLDLDGLCKETPKRMTVQFLSGAEVRDG